MSRKVITLEIDAEHEDLLRRYAGFLEEMKDLAATAPDGSVLDACEEAVIEKGREHQRRLLEHAVQARLDARREKGAPLRTVPLRPGPRESRDRHARGLHLPGPDHLEAALVGLAMPLLAGRLSRRCRARARRRPQPPTATQGLPLRRRPVLRAGPASTSSTCSASRPAAETLRVYCERQAGRVARWQGQETASAEGFRQAEGGWEFTVDAGKVNTREEGWRDLKIAVAQKRPAAEPATPEQWESRELPEATARVMWADISATRRFRRSWHARLRRLGLPAMARLHVLGDGASWIWKAAGRALTGCRQTLDIYHASQHIAAAGKRLYGEGTPEATRSTSTAASCC